MDPPVILAVHGDPSKRQKLNAELTDRYSTGYRVECVSSADKALAKLGQMADHGVRVALVLCAQDLPEMLGTELLARARLAHPHAKRALVLPWGVWADRAVADVILDSMAMGATDSHLLDPAPPRDEGFHEGISSLLFEWSREQRVAPYTIHVVGESWSGRSYELRETLQRCALPHSFCLTDSPRGKELLAKADDDDPEVPLIVLPNGEVMSNPTDRELAESDGIALRQGEDVFDVVVVGAGPAGLCAAVYGASEGLSTLVIDGGGVGGQATASSMIRNYLGFPRGISGGHLAHRAYEQAWIFRANFSFMTTATRLERSDNGVLLHLSDDRAVTGRAVILATGAAYRTLDVAELEGLEGAGVFYGGPMSESVAMEGKDVFVAGGANSAGQAALYLARYARQVTLVVRGDSLEGGMSHYLVRELRGTANVRIMTRTEIVGGAGDGRLERLLLRDGEEDETHDLPADALFILIGAEPRTTWMPEEIARDEQGFLLTGQDVPADGTRPDGGGPLSLETSMPCVFAAGDVRHGSIRRVASAVGEGSIAIQQAHLRLGELQI